jgi:hypothetical protein
MAALPLERTPRSRFPSGIPAALLPSQFLPAPLALCALHALQHLLPHARPAAAAGAARRPRRLGPIRQTAASRSSRCRSRTRPPEQRPGGGARHEQDRGHAGLVRDGSGHAAARPGWWGGNSGRMRRHSASGSSWPVRVRHGRIIAHHRPTPPGRSGQCHGWVTFVQAIMISSRWIGQMTMPGPRR